jgi:F-type H+-transporting ATPase subunit b
MLIDWFTVGAQALNFLILVWLMKRYLYHPVLNAIDAREKRIAAQIADAQALKAAASRERDDFQHKNDEFEKQRASLLAKATDEATVVRQGLMEEARKAADSMGAKREESLRKEARNLTQAITQRTQKEVFAIVRKTLGDLATSGLEECMVDVFIRRLRKVDGTVKVKLAAAVKAAPESAVVRSAFELPPEERATVQNAINEVFSADVSLRFEAVPDLVGGIEFTASGQKLAWNIANYLTDLEASVGELLKKQEKPVPKPDAQPAPKNRQEEVTQPESESNPELVPTAAEKSEPPPASS